MLVFIGVQAVLSNRQVDDQVLDMQAVRRKRQRLALGFGAVVILVVLAIVFMPKFGSILAGNKPTETTECEVKPFRKEDAARLVQDGAVIAYHRLAGPDCIDEMYAIYPDGRILVDNGENKIETMVPPADVENVLTTISQEYGWFTNEIRDTYHVPCRQCFAHYVIIARDGQEKGVTAVDGGVNMPPGYGVTLAVIRSLLPENDPVP
jgi:hypothetical protein